MSFVRKHFSLLPLTRILRPACDSVVGSKFRCRWWLALATVMLTILGWPGFVAASPGNIIFVTSTEQKISSFGGCSLQEAIYSSINRANTAIDDTAPGAQPIPTQCVPGTGEDTIVLPAGQVFRMSKIVNDHNNPFGPTATPMITTLANFTPLANITIEANGSRLELVPGSPIMRAFAVDGTAHLTIRNAHIKGFGAKGGNGAGGGGGGMGAGGAIYVNGGGLTVENSTFEANGAIGGNGSALDTSGGAGGGGGGGLSGNGGTEGLSGGGGGGSRGNGVFGGGGTVTLGLGGFSADGGFSCGGSGGKNFSDDGADGFCPGGGGGGGHFEGVIIVGEINGGSGGNGNYGGGGGCGGTSNGDGGNGGFGGGGGAGTAFHVFTGHGGDGGFGGGGGAGHGGSISGGPGHAGSFAGDAGQDSGGGGAALGGAIFNDGGSVVIANSTFTANFVDHGVGGGPPGDDGADAGGAIFSANGRLTVLNATISGNQSTGSGGGIVVFQTLLLGLPLFPVSFTLENTIIFNNGAMDVSGHLTNAINECSILAVSITGGFTNNLIQNNGNCPGVVSTDDPQLGPLQFNTGLTPTMAIPQTSPAFNAADSGVDSGGTSLLSDQRGVDRPQAGGFDIGAYELCVSHNPAELACKNLRSLPPPDTEPLTVQVSPAAGGITNPLPGTSATVTDSVIAIMATPNLGYAFTGWSLNVADPSNPSTFVTMDQPQTVTANFVVLPTTMLGNITAKAGPQNARAWTLSLINNGPGVANATAINSFTLVQTSGTACTPVVGTAFPVVVGDMAPVQTRGALVNINFTGCAASARFTAKFTYSANAGAVSGYVLRYNQFQ